MRVGPLQRQAHARRLLRRCQCCRHGWSSHLESTPGYRCRWGRDACLEGHSALQTSVFAARGSGFDLVQSLEDRLCRLLLQDLLQRHDVVGFIMSIQSLLTCPRLVEHESAWYSRITVKVILDAPIFVTGLGNDSQQSRFHNLLRSRSSIDGDDEGQRRVHFFLARFAALFSLRLWAAGFLAALLPLFFVATMDSSPAAAHDNRSHCATVLRLRPAHCREPDA